MKKVKRSSFCL